MGQADSIPVVSQTKSLIQVVGGNTEGAARTQQNFVRECPGVSQVTSVVQLAAGDPEGALETQKRCGRAMSNLVDSVPVVGHVKGVVHHVVGDKEGGDRAIKSATQTTGAIVGGAGGLLVGAPVGAVTGAVRGARAAADTAASAVTGQRNPAGNRTWSNHPADRFSHLTNNNISNAAAFNPAQGDRMSEYQKESYSEDEVPEVPLEDDVSTSRDRKTATLTKNLPSGSRLRNVANQGPVSQVATRTVNSSLIVDYVRAYIRSQHISTGMDVGQIVVNALGGLVDKNVFPLNDNRYYKILERLIKEFLINYHKGFVEYQVRLVYNRDQIRPYGLFVLVRFNVYDDGVGGWRSASSGELRLIDEGYDNPLFQWIWNQE